MNTETKIDIASVVGIREAMAQIFRLIYRHLESYTSNPADSQQIENCHYYTHQLKAMLEMLGLGGIAFVSQNLEALLKSLCEQKIASQPDTLHVVRQSLRSIERYLNALVDGEEDNPAKLFPVYRKIMQAQGLEEVSASDLFFPSMRESLPLTPASSDLDAPARQTAARQARTLFQTGLVNWLRDSSNKQSLQQMIDAVRMIEQLPAPIEQRAFWWISTGFLDSLLHQEQSVDHSIRRLCGKIEQEIRRLNNEAHTVADQLTRELLYRVARCQPVSERLQEINRVYDWQQLLSSFDNLDPLAEIAEDDLALPESELEAMRALLSDMADRWYRFSFEEADDRTTLTALSEQFQVLAAKSNCPTLETLAGAVHNAWSGLSMPVAGEDDSILLVITDSLALIENMLETIQQLPPELSSKAASLADRIHALMAGEAVASPLADAPETHQDMDAAQALMQQATQEIRANLTQIEDILERFFIDAGALDDLSMLPRLFTQIGGMLAMLELDRAGILLDLCHGQVKKLMNSAHSAHSGEQTLLADALSSFGFYIETLGNPQPDREALVEAAISMFDQPPADEALDAGSEPLPQSTAASPESSEPMIDTDLLTIFLDECNDVLASIAEHLQASRHDPADMEALAAIRQGFHTLKESSRMVALPDLGEVAWRIEQLMNRWLGEQAPATDCLLALLEDSHQYFGVWCAHLAKNGEVEIEAAALIERIRNIMHGASEPSASVPADDSLCQPVMEVKQDQSQLLDEAAANRVTEAVNENLLSDPGNESIDPEAQTPIGETIESGSHQADVQTIPAVPACNLPEAIETGGHTPILQVEAELIDCLVDDASEASVARSQVEKQLYGFEQQLQHLGKSIHRMRERLHAAETGADSHSPGTPSSSTDNPIPAETGQPDHSIHLQQLTQQLETDLDELLRAHQNLLTTQQAAQSALDQQVHLNYQLQQTLDNIRFKPFSYLCAQLQQVVSESARDTNRQINFIIQGEDLAIEQRMLETIRAPLTHVLQGVLQHGAESADEPRQAGRLGTGQITFNLRQEANGVVITLSADGIEPAGEHFHRNEKVHQPELTDPDEAHDAGDGLDDFKHTLAAIGASITITSDQNRRTTCTLRLPALQTVTRTWITSVAGSTYGIPASLVTQVLEMDDTALATAYQAGSIDWQGERFPVAYLPNLLGETDLAPAIECYQRILLLQSGQTRLAVHAGELAGRCEIIMKDLGSQLSRVPGLAGAAMIGEDVTMLIIDPLKLMQYRQAKEGSLLALSFAPAGSSKPLPESVAQVVESVD
ncbi:chemotaxis protein CheW [Nitrosomonas sp. ANs5]|uniref:chemotaxis protein CheW n=1 Tax=Nitrosomonas sp. ANs5 TaxID=3423941 RepID=UPI003D33BB5E